VTVAFALAERNVPRYTSYPTAPHFSAAVTPARYRQWLEALPRAANLSLYIHVPFCEELCHYCGCNTRAVRKRGPVDAYAEELLKEITLLRLLEGRIHAGIDEPARAERDFEEARRGFAELGQPYMATLVLLDLAALHIRQGRDENARREALEAADIFLGLNIGREAAVAMMLLKSTVKFRLATTAVLLEEMAEFMRAAEHDPQLSFHNYFS